MNDVSVRQVTMRLDIQFWARQVIDQAIPGSGWQQCLKQGEQQHERPGIRPETYSTAEMAVLTALQDASMSLRHSSGAREPSRQSTGPTLAPIVASDQAESKAARPSIPKPIPCTENQSFDGRDLLRIRQALRSDSHANTNDGPRNQQVEERGREQRTMLRTPKACGRRSNQRRPRTPTALWQAQ